MIAGVHEGREIHLRKEEANREQHKRKVMYPGRWRDPRRNCFGPNKFPVRRETGFLLLWGSMKHP